MKRDFKLFIRDILEAIENIEDFIWKMDFNQLIVTKKREALWSGR